MSQFQPNDWEMGYGPAEAYQLPFAPLDQHQFRQDGYQIPFGTEDTTGPQYPMLLARDDNMHNYGESTLPGRPPIRLTGEANVY